MDIGGTLMSVATVESRSVEAAAYGGFLDAIGGIATAVLAIMGLTGFDPTGMAAIATIVFGAALLVQGGTILSEYSQVVSLAPASSSALTGGEGLPAMFMAGVAGIVLGVLALLGIAYMALIAVALIVFGAALVLSSGSLRQLYAMRSQSSAGMLRPGNELLTGQMTAGSAGVQLLAGLAAAVLGILAVAGHMPEVLALAALLVLGVTVLLTGSTLSSLVLSFMRPARTPSSSTGTRLGV